MFIPDSVVSVSHLSYSSSIYVASNSFNETQKCPSFNYLKKGFTKENLNSEKSIDYLLCFVYDKNIEITRQEIFVSPYVHPGESASAKTIKIPMESFVLHSFPELVTLSSIGKYSVANKLMQLLNVPTRAWAAHILLANMTGKNGIIFSHYLDITPGEIPKEWWLREGKTGKAKTVWDKDFFNKPGYDLYWKPGGTFYIRPHGGTTLNKVRK